MEETHGRGPRSGRIPLRDGGPGAVMDVLSGCGFHPLLQVGDTLPFARDADGAEIEWIRDARGLNWLDYRDLPEQDADRLFRELPRLKPEDVLDLLRADDPRLRRQGLLQAGLLQDEVLADSVIALTRDPDPRVAQDAEALSREISGVVPGSPDSAYRAFDATLDAHDRRQVMRWLIHDAEESNESLRAVVVAALMDPDWEVRVAAMIAAARLRLVDLAEQVAACPLPRVSRLGPVKLDRQILFAVKQAVLWSFAGEALPAVTPEGLKPWRWWHVRRLVLGLPPDRQDHAFLLMHALTTPLPAAAPPRDLPPGVEEYGHGYRLSGTDLDLAWVPPLPHWLGDDDAVANPLRKVRPTGFFIARDSVSVETASVMFGIDSARERLAALGEPRGARLALPTPEQWEAAARGPDGRRFPWGNGHEADWPLRASPWGVVNLFGEAGCWCADARGLWLAGGEPVTRLADAVRPADGIREAALRPVVAIR